VNAFAMTKRWQDSATEEEWDHWNKVALNIASKEVNTSLGADDYAAQAIEKLLKEKIRPVDVEAWLKTVISRGFIDRHRKIEVRPQRVDFNNTEDVIRGLLHQPNQSLGSLFVTKEIAKIVFEELSPKDQKLVLLKADGWENQEIAEDMGYASARVVANRFKLVGEKMAKRFGPDGEFLFKNSPKSM
jgi:RNA polymerase sigma factor (sigma-70 family)